MCSSWYMPSTLHPKFTSRQIMKIKFFKLFKRKIISFLLNDWCWAVWNLEKFLCSCSDDIFLLFFSVEFIEAIQKFQSQEMYNFHLYHWFLHESKNLSCCDYFSYAHKYLLCWKFPFTFLITIYNRKHMYVDE